MASGPQKPTPEIAPSSPRPGRDVSLTDEVNETLPQPTEDDRLEDADQADIPTRPEIDTPDAVRAPDPRPGAPEPTEPFPP